MDINMTMSRQRLIAAACVGLLLGSTAYAAQREDAQEVGANRADPSPAPAEVETWRALAHARFVTGDVKGALDALNMIDEPRVSTIEIEGLVRTRRDVGRQYLGLKPGDLLTAARLSRMERRVDEFPVATSATVRYDAVDGSAIVRPIVFERNRFHSNVVDWLPVGIRLLLMQELRVQLSDVAHRAEVWTPSYRWAENRPRARLQFSAPAPGALPGLLHLEGGWQRETYRSAAFPGGVFREERLRGRAALSDWLTGWLRWEGGGVVDRIDGVTYVGFDGSLNTRLGSHVALIATAGQSIGVNRADPFSHGEIALTLRSTSKPDVPALTATTGVARVTDNAPLSFWPAGGASQGRGILLRAHPLHPLGIIDGERLGRQVLFTTTEYVHPVPTPIGFVGIAGFVDGARTMIGLVPHDPVLDVDIGTGLRFNISRAGNKARVDVGYGLRDGRVRVTADYVHPWGGRIIR